MLLVEFAVKLNAVSLTDHRKIFSYTVQPGVKINFFDHEVEIAFPLTANSSFFSTLFMPFYQYFSDFNFEKNVIPK